MKELTQKFRENFETFNFDEKAIDVLLILMDSIIGMLNKTDYGDSAYYMKKMCSFLKMISSDYCEDILDIEMVKAMYSVQILPILNYFDKKYDPDSSKGAIRLAKQLLDDSETKNPLEGFTEQKEIDEDYDIDNVVSYYNTKFGNKDYDPNNKLHPINIKSYDNRLLFSALQSATEDILIIYEYISMDDCDKEKVLQKLNAIQFSTEITKCHKNNYIRDISQKIYKLCEIMLCIIESDRIDIPEIINNEIHLIFNSINNLEFKE